MLKRSLNGKFYIRYDYGVDDWGDSEVKYSKKEINSWKKAYAKKCRSADAYFAQRARELEKERRATDKAKEQFKRLIKKLGARANKAPVPNLESRKNDKLNILAQAVKNWQKELERRARIDDFKKRIIRAVKFLARFN